MSEEEKAKGAEVALPSGQRPPAWLRVGLDHLWVLALPLLLGLFLLVVHFTNHIDLTEVPPHPRIVQLAIALAILSVLFGIPYLMFRQIIDQTRDDLLLHRDAKLSVRDAERRFARYGKLLKPEARDAVSAALGMQAKALEPLRAIALSDPGSKTADAAAMASIAGRWAASDTSSDGAWFKREYVLGGDGKYRYKSERRSGPAPANRYDTVEEGGRWTIAGTQLTLAPEWSTLTIRDGAGNITGGRASPNERVAYGWDLSLAAAAGEAQLVLRTPKPTNRDGALVADAPEAVYRFARSTRVEWRW